MRQIINSRAFLALILALPALLLIDNLSALAAGRVEAGFLYRITGEWAARLLILTLAITPLTAIFPGARFPRWLAARRRWIGVASFLYVCFHAVVYLTQLPGFGALFMDLGSIEIVFGWLGFAVLLPLAVTSHDAAVRAMGVRRWKMLQRGAYLAAVLAAVHWMVSAHHIGPVLVHFGLLAALEAWRILAPRQAPATRTA